MWRWLVSIWQLSRDSRGEAGLESSSISRGFCGHIWCDLDRKKKFPKNFFFLLSLLPLIPPLLVRERAQSRHTPQPIYAATLDRCIRGSRQLFYEFLVSIGVRPGTASLSHYTCPAYTVASPLLLPSTNGIGANKNISCMHSVRLPHVLIAPLLSQRVPPTCLHTC